MRKFIKFEPKLGDDHLFFLDVLHLCFNCCLIKIFLASLWILSKIKFAFFMTALN